MYVDDAYVLAFADNEGEVHDVHITDELNSIGTWEYIDFKFTLPHSCYILIWRRDKKRFDKENTRDVTKYVRDDLKEFTEEGEMNGSVWHQKIKQKLVDSKNCLILAWDKMELPLWWDTWEEFAKDIHEIAKNESKQIVKPGSRHDQDLTIYEGKIDFNRQDNPILKSYSTRKNKYIGYTIPSDETIQKYVTELLLENYADANIILSKHYDVFPATLETEGDFGKSFVEYDFVNHRILLDVERLATLELRIPALLLGFFKHLSCVKDWVFSTNEYESILLEKGEAEKFSYETIQKMLEIGIDPR